MTMSNGFRYNTSGTYEQQKLAREYVKFPVPDQQWVQMAAIIAKQVTSGK